MKNKKNGVTIIELIFTIVILNILMFMGYPMYEGYIKDANAEQAKQQLFLIANDFEKIKSRMYTYTKVIDENTGNIINGISTLYTPTGAKSEDEKKFLISATNIGTNSFELIATPTKEQGLDYGVLTLDYIDSQLTGKYKKEDGSVEIWY